MCRQLIILYSFLALSSAGKSVASRHAHVTSISGFMSLLLDGDEVAMCHIATTLDLLA